MLLISAALLHELGHFLAIKLTGGRVGRVDIMPLGARIVTSGITSHRRDTAVYLCGPLANLLFFGLSLPVSLALASPYLLYFSICNLFFAFVNLLPVSGNDGYCALCSLISAKSESGDVYALVSRAGKISEFVFVLISAVSVFASGFNPGVIGLTAAANIYKKD